MLAALRRPEHSEPDRGTATRTRRAAAERALWTWYLEWSAIARAVIKEPYLSRRLGFGRV